MHQMDHSNRSQLACGTPLDSGKTGLSNAGAISQRMKDHARFQILFSLTSVLGAFMP